MKILKFGGTSVGNAERILHVVDIIQNYHLSNVKIAAVFSAFSGVTDQLIEVSNRAIKRDNSYLGLYQNLRLKHIDIFDLLVTHSKKKSALKHITDHFDELNDILKGLYLLRELTPRILDNILSYGERLSAFIISEALKSKNVDCEYVNTATIIKTDSGFGNAHVNYELTNRNIIDHFKTHSQIQIITGFIASNDDGEITTLGRGGSDFTASIIGAAVTAKEIEIWTE